MKRIKKSTIPIELKKYIDLDCDLTKDWEDDFKNDCQDGYKIVIEQIKKDQGNICCYCELSFSDNVTIRPDFRVEHFHPKSDDPNEGKNWNLEWTNLLGCCHGGSEHRTISGEDRFIQNVRHRHSDILKNNFIWDEEILNPLEIPAYPPIFEVSNEGVMSVAASITGDIKRKAENSLKEDRLNLNSPKLVKWREQVINILRLQLDALYQVNNDMAESVSILVDVQLSKDETGNYFSFFSTIRSFFGVDAEAYLQRTNYDG
ncbi:retron system putative HNH endonuclease [Sulfurospirillum oryzae]|uniref:retron system putative HNH endonuclease n=1 Tax=Sulfurospirillum oryzae TaxID=2976535 RepID=UPI0021E8A0D0|nr:retron system putative HNH endonuclease [Sulfurospirillum oryzae]